METGNEGDCSAGARTDQLKKTAEIVIEKEELILVRRREQVVRAWCDDCVADVEMWPPEIAAVVFGLGGRRLYRLIECGHVHFTENAAGLVRVCARSLHESLSTSQRHMEREERQ